MLESLITSKTRIKLLLKFFINPGTKAYLRELANEFDESTNSVRLELNRLTKANLLISQNRGRTILYNANKEHTFFRDIQNIALKYVGIDHIIENMVQSLRIHQRVQIQHLINRNTIFQGLISTLKMR